MEQSSVFIQENKETNPEYWIIDLFLHDTFEDLPQRSVLTTERARACFRHSLAKRKIGSIHVCSKSEELLEDILHETIHATIQLVVKSDPDEEDPINQEELLCQHFEHILPRVLDFYGFEIKRRETSK
jgi:hypothetical protein